MLVLSRKLIANPYLIALELGAKVVTRGSCQLVATTSIKPPRKHEQSLQCRRPAERACLYGIAHDS